ncbi:hypothetical protein HNY73_021596 [Argiope bruennichi]|uniref:ZSWIM1/3 RNaseH-like domain-containing protein n=1 Tax=Argiope bruennichi TaxID=94029 RepID=A0A8T0DY14_ARGBR|nr:hypothetical protein HNY73_021596 [Argiope bruennichi]
MRKPCWGFTSHPWRVRSYARNSKGERIRHLKASGSIKAGSTCPAVMNVTTVTVDGIAEINVRYQAVHVGHDLDVGKIPLSKNERLDLAADLQLGIPMAKILDKTRENFSATSRLSLTTRKDLHNISRDFRISSDTVHHQYDATSVDILVKKFKNEPFNPVLVYKETLPDYPSIRQEDFLLGLMNDAQEKLFKLYGSSCVMIDSTHGTNQYGYELTTLMVHDENHEGLPVATLFSSRTGSDILLPFFENIKKQKTENSQEDHLVIDVNNSKEKQAFEKEAILPSLQKQDEDVNLKKDILLKELKELESIRKDWETLEDWNPLPAALEKIKSIKAMFQIASAGSYESKELPEISKLPPNKLISKQRKKGSKKNMICFMSGFCMNSHIIFPSFSWVSLLKV